MSDRISKIKAGSYVKLKKGFDNTDFYRGVVAGATGWVTDSKIDEDGFALVYIEWDELNNNWSGEKDKWAYESHFEVLEDPEMDLNLNEEYISHLRGASDSALASEAFLMITTTKISTPGNLKGNYISQVYGFELDPKAVDAIDRTILMMAEFIKSKKKYK